MVNAICPMMKSIGLLYEIGEASPYELMHETVFIRLLMSVLFRITTTEICRRAKMVEFLKTLAIACIPAIITGIVTYIVARKNAASQISIIKEQNKHDLEKLMEQHKVDIEHLKEAHRLDMEAKEQDHKNKLELQQKEFENSLPKQQKDGENAMATETIKGVLGLVGSAVTTAMDTPEAKQLLSDSIKQSFNKSKEG